MKAINRIVGILLSIGAAILALIPTWIYLGIKLLFSPTGFWQNLVLLGLGIWGLGGIQFILLIVLAVFLYAIWSD